MRFRLRTLLIVLALFAVGVPCAVFCAYFGAGIYEAISLLDDD